MAPVKDIKPMQRVTVRCGQDRCEQPALFLFVAARFSDGLWAYCEEHAQLRARQERLELPKEMAATAGSW